MARVRLEKNPTFLTVVAAAIRDETGRLLLQQRPAHKHHGGAWEFPGGKVEVNETPRDSLRREIAEELSLELDCAAMEPIGFADEPAEMDHPALVLVLYNCPRWSGEPVALEQQNWGWFTHDQAALLNLAPMDRHLLAQSVAGAPRRA